MKLFSNTMLGNLLMVYGFVQGNSCQSSGQQHKPIPKSHSIGNPTNILDSPSPIHDVFNNGTLICSEDVIATSYSLMQNEAYVVFIIFYSLLHKCLSPRSMSLTLL